MNDLPLPAAAADAPTSSLCLRARKNGFSFRPGHAIAFALLTAVALEILYYQQAVQRLQAEPITVAAAPVPPPLRAATPAPSLSLNPEPHLDRRHTESPAPAPRQTAPRAPEPEVHASRPQPSADDRVREAYEAWSHNDLVTAKRLYGEALEIAPGHRQAQLGLAAVAVRHNDLSGARFHYQNLLEKDPYDGDAVAGLMNLVSDSPVNEQESLLKLLIEHGTSAPSVYTQLGNIYARQGRWGEAHQCYLEAYRRDATLRQAVGNGDADISFNLAVSLDHLGQMAAAAEHYRQAIAYAQTGPFTFPAPQARARLNALELPAGGP